MSHLPWWRILIMIVVAVAVVWWLRQRVRNAEELERQADRLAVLEIRIAPAEGSEAIYAVSVGSTVIRVPWVVAGGPSDTEAGLAARDAALAEVGKAAAAAKAVDPAPVGAEIVVEAVEMGTVPFGLPVMLLEVLMEAGFADVTFQGKDTSVPEQIDPSVEEPDPSAEQPDPSAEQPDPSAEQPDPSAEQPDQR